VLLQATQLGAVQLAMSGAVNSLLVFGAAGISAFLARNGAWLRAQRLLMGTVLGALAARMALADPK
jgi:threonine/homoserine/homoserine lactone efflux protein